MTFPRLYEPVRLTELEALLKQRSLSRKGNIENWVTAVSTPASGHDHHMALGTTMMGLPVLGGELVGMEEVNMLDLERDRDPDLDSLREELRPQFKSRFEGWVGATFTIGKYDQVFRAVYKELLVVMPFLRDPEVVDEMIGRCVPSLFRGVFPSSHHLPSRFLRMANRPSKHHICDGFETLLSFVKTELCKEQVRAEKRRRKEARTKGKEAVRTGQPSSSAQRTRAANSTSRTPASRGNASPSSMYTRQPQGGFDDVD
jgi:hypothetical protein